MQYVFAASAGLLAYAVVWMIGRRAGWGQRMIMLAPIWAMGLVWPLVWVLMGQFDLASGVTFAVLSIGWLTVWLLFSARRTRAHGD